MTLVTLEVLENSHMLTFKNMIKDIRAEYAIIRTTDGNYRLWLPYLDQYSYRCDDHKGFTVEEMVKKFSDQIKKK